MKKDQEFRVDAESTLLSFLLTCFPNKSRNYVKGILKRGQIALNGEVCKDFSRMLYPGQQVKALLNILPNPDEMSIPIIYEDDAVVVIDKPAGMLSVSSDKERENTAFHIVNEHIKKQSNHGRIFIVHRLDRETSGVMLLAKTEKTKLALQANWTDNALYRGYIAVVEGKVMIPKKRIVSWLKQTKTLLVYSGDREGDGKIAITNYETRQTTDSYSLLDISLETGRKNQIRVHMKDIGHPVAGDKKYGALTDPFGRLGLHASALIIKHPQTGEQMRFEAPVPNAFKKVF